MGENEIILIASLKNSYDLRLEKHIIAAF